MSLLVKQLVGPCALIFASGKTGAWRTIRPDVVVDTCILCGICEKYCPTNAITVVKSEEKDSGLTIALDYCKGCGICSNVCPIEAMEMIPEREEFR